MDMTRFLLTAMLLASTLAAQATKEVVVKIAPEKEELLKSRVNKFWDGFVAGKYRASDELVAEEAKEDFFSWPKKKIRGYKIDHIYYSPGGKQAKVVTFVDTSLNMMGVGAMDIKQPVETWWKEEADGWYWFLPKNEMRETPFGKMESNAKSGEAPLIATGQMSEKQILDSLRFGVKPDRTTVEFVAGEEKTEKVSFRNGLPGVVTLSIDTPLSDELSFDLSSKKIDRDGTAELIVVYKPKSKKVDPDAEPVTKTVRVGVAQTGTMHAIKVTVAPPKK